MKSFFDLPRLSLDEAINGGISEKTIALIGSKVVTESMHLSKGMKNAADVIREKSREITGYLHESGIDIHLKDIIDLGNYGREKIGKVVKLLLEQKALPFVIGGDHATSYFALKHVELSPLLWLDAHTDLAKETEIPKAKEISHGSILRLLVEKGAKATVIGFRGYSTVKKELERAENLDVNVFPYPFKEKVLLDFLEKAQVVSLDLDFFSATNFPAVRVPEMNGPQIREFIQILKRSQFNPLYIDLTEYLPIRDPKRCYATIISQVIVEILGNIVNGREDP